MYPPIGVMRFQSFFSFVSPFFNFFLFPCRSDSFRNFVDSCLQKIPQDRPTSDVLLNVRTATSNLMKNMFVELILHFSACSTGSCAASVR